MSKYFTRLQALGNTAIIKPLEQQNKTPSGKLFIPETSKLKNIEGIVVSVSDGVRTENGDLIPHDVKQGDHIIYDYRAGDPVDIDGEKYLFLPIEALLAKKV